MKSFIKTFFEKEVSDTINGFCVLKPEFLEHEDEFIKKLNDNGWKICQKHKHKFTNDEASNLYKKLKDKDFYKELCDYMASDTCLCCTCYKDCEDPIKDMNKLKDEIRKKWGKSEMKNAMHSSDSLENVNRESKIVFNK